MRSSIRAFGYVRVCAVAFFGMLLGWSPLLDAASQLSPNPNPGGNSISIGSGDTRDNSLSYYNYGTIANSGTLNNFQFISNYNQGDGPGLLNNLGTLNNSGLLVAEGVSLSDKGEINNSAAIFNSGVITTQYYGSFVNGLTGTVDNMSGCQFNFFGTVYNAGSIINNNGSPVSGGIYGLNSGVFTNAATGTLANYASSLVYINGQIYNNGSITNNGVFAVGNSGWLQNSNSFTSSSTGEISIGGQWIHQAGATMSIAGAFVNSGTVVLQEAATFAGTSTIANYGQFTAEAGFTHNGAFSLNSGTFEIQSAATVSGSGSLSGLGGTARVNGTLSQTSINFGFGELTGSGTVISTGGAVVMQSGATIRPGESVGTLSIAADVTMDGTMQSEIASDSSFDVLAVSGTMTIGAGTSLVLQFYYVPLDGTSYDLIMADNIVGNFENASYFIPFGEEDPIPENISLLLEVLSNPNGPGEVLRATILIPEPSGIALLVLGAATLLRRRRPVCMSLTADRSGARPHPCPR